MQEVAVERLLKSSKALGNSLSASKDLLRLTSNFVKHHSCWLASKLSKVNSIC